MHDSTNRFSSRVVDYVRSRPRYPAAVLTTLQERGVLSPSSVVADIGSGTGLLTELFLRNGNEVYAVEPNDAMRAAGERLLAGYANFHSVAGAAESTRLADQSIDLIAAGQAFHWFDRPKTRREFDRLFRPGGWVALVWNERETETSQFLRDYEQLLLRYSTDYTQIDHRRIDEKILGEFYGPGGFQTVTMPNRQDFDFDGLKGRLLSSSYAPQAGHPDHEAMLAELRRLFETHQTGGQVAIEYTTKLYSGGLVSAATKLLASTAALPAVSAGRYSPRAIALRACASLFLVAPPMSEPLSTDDEPIEESMFERTAAGVVRFIGRALFTTGLTLATPKRVAELACTGDPRLAPPLSYLTAAMFIAGVSVRTHGELEYVDQVSAGQLVGDLCTTMAETSLSSAAVMTFPCVLIVVALATLLSWMGNVRTNTSRSPLFACCCYAAGFTYMMVAAAGFTAIGCRIALNDDSSPFDDDKFNYSMLGMMFFFLGEGVLVIACSLKGESCRPWARTFRYPAAFTAMCVAGIACGLALTESFDVEGAMQASRERSREEERSGLKVDTIKWTARRNPAGGPDIVAATLALSNLEAAPLIVPCPETIAATDSEGLSDRSLEPYGPESRVVSCSIDQLEGGALLIKPGETQLITIEYAAPTELAKPAIEYDQVPYALTYETPSDLRYFHAAVAELWLPAPAASSERTALERATDIERR